MNSSANVLHGVTFVLGKNSKLPTNGLSEITDNVFYNGYKTKTPNRLERLFMKLGLITNAKAFIISE